MSKRINIVLPEATVQTIDRLAKPGERSRFINRAVQHFVATRSADALRGQLEQTAVRDQDLDREIAAELFAVDQETWRQFDKKAKLVEPTTPSGVKSTSRRSTRQ